MTNKTHSDINKYGPADFFKSEASKAQPYRDNHAGESLVSPLKPGCYSPGPNPRNLRFTEVKEEFDDGILYVWVDVYLDDFRIGSITAYPKPWKGWAVSQAVLDTLGGDENLTAGLYNEIGKRSLSEIKEFLAALHSRT